MNKFVVILTILLLTGCATTTEQTAIPATKVDIKPTQQPIVKQVEKRPVPVKKVVKQPKFNIRGFRQQTYATWYNITEHGNPTANGAVYDYYAMTAAHQNLPFGSQVRVRHIATGRSIVVTINDRLTTPVIKLSTFAAKKLGVWGKTGQMVLIEGLR
jgi:rare lipoprotein A